MKKMLFPMLILVLLLCGCSGKEEQTAVVFEDAATFPTGTVETFPLLEITGETADRSHEELYTDFGRFWSEETDPENNGPYVLMFSDFEAGTAYPLCPRANCRHDSADCGAYFPFAGGSPDFLYFDGEYLYFYLRSSQTLYRQKPDGSDRQTVADLSESVTAVNTIVYGEDTAWLLCELMAPDEEGTELIVRKTIVRLELRSGDWAELPFTFAGDMANVELYGKYGDELLMRYTYSTGLVPFQDPEETKNILFLFHVETGDLTRLTEYGFTYASSAQCPRYLIYCVFDPESEYAVTARGEEWSAFSGEMQIFDLNERVCYRMESDCLTWEFSIRDGKLFYCELGEDGVTLEGKILDLATGEVMDWLFYDSEPRIQWVAETETGEYFIVLCEDRLCRIAKADYYAGNRELIPVP